MRVRPSLACSKGGGRSGTGNDSDLHAVRIPVRALAVQSATIQGVIRYEQIANLGTYPGKRFCDQDPAWQEQELAQVKRAIDIAVLVGARSIRVTASLP